MPSTSLRFLLLAATLGTTACSAILDADAEQCQNAEDCGFLGSEFTCRDSVCVEAEASSSCPPVTAYAWSESIAAVRNACDLPVQVSGRVLQDGVNEVEVASPLAQPIPFDWCFYGEEATQLWIGDNGYVAFGDQPPGAIQAQVGAAHSLGQPGVPAPGVAAFWDALLPSAEGVCAAVEGDPGAQTLWITWSGACFEDGTARCDADSGSSLTFSVGLEEATGTILIGYPSMTGTGPLDDRAKGQSATIGITDDVPAACPASECSADGICGNGEPCGYTEVSAQRILDPLPTIEFTPG